MKPSSDEWLTRLAKARHDLRDPVSHILGFAEMLQCQPGTEPAPGFSTGIQALTDAGHGMLHAINHHLEPASIRAGQTDLARFETELRILAGKVREISANLREQRPGPGEDAADDLDRISIAAQQLLAVLSREMEFLQAPSSLESIRASLEAQAAGRAEGSAPVSVLVVDDLAEVHSVVQAALAREGWAVHLRVTGQEAIAFVAHQRVDVLLLDTSMPGLDGVETLRRLKADPAHRHLPVIMLTFSEPGDVLNRCKDLGASGFLAKPFTAEQLTAAINAALLENR